jgi:hypothetical protein
MGVEIDFRSSAAESVKSYAKQLRRLAPGRERERVIAAMRDDLRGRPSRQPAWHPALMPRISRRPLPSGRIEPSRALLFGLLLASASIPLLTFGVGPIPAALAAIARFDPAAGGLRECRADRRPPALLP